MAMNKKERAEFDAAKKAVVVARALNWSPPVEYDLIPNISTREMRGFVFNPYNCTILFALSNNIYHATSDSEPPPKTRSQNSLRMYSTKLLALRALRNVIEKECAEKLASIDMQIQAKEKTDAK